MKKIHKINFIRSDHNFHSQHFTYFTYNKNKKPHKVKRATCNFSHRRRLHFDKSAETAISLNPKL